MITAVPTQRPAWADIDLSAIAHNARQLCALSAPAQLCAVVKANGYGHGAVDVARAALRGGATWLGVALVEEGIALRSAGLHAPILVLSEPQPDAMHDVVHFRLTPAVYTRQGVAAAAAAVRVAGSAPLAVHVKIDTGMHRVGAPAVEALALVEEITALAELRLGGIFTHLAVADEVDNPYTDGQLHAFAQAIGTLDRRPALCHAANSAAALWHPAARLDMVRCGIALYGLAPTGELAPSGELGSPGLAPAGEPAGPGDSPGEVLARLRPALSLRARVSYVKTLDAGARLSYGLRYRLPVRSVVATVPLGYADGVPRRLGSCGGEVLIGGRRRPIAGAVTMDQILVDCGPDATVERGDEVVLIGSQGSETIGAWEWAERMGTIAYEVVCAISERVPRRLLHDEAE